MAGAPAAKMRINLDRAVVLIVDNSLGLDILSNIFLGFGVRNLHRARTIVEAMEVVKTYQIDLIVMETLMPDEDAYAFVQTIRRLESEEVASPRWCCCRRTQPPRGSGWRAIAGPIS